VEGLAGEVQVDRRPVFHQVEIDADVRVLPRYRWTLPLPGADLVHDRVLDLEG
jgi:hypothetical protein